MAKSKSKKQIYEQKAEALVLPLVQKCGLELVDVEFVTEGGIHYLRICIDKDGGITFDDCKRIHNPYSKLLDQEDFIEESYMLEISSPGLERPLKKDRDYERNLGREIEVRTYTKISGAKEFIGLLSEWDKESVTLELDEGELIVIQRSNIAMIREYAEI